MNLRRGAKLVCFVHSLISLAWLAADKQTPLGVYRHYHDGGESRGVALASTAFDQAITSQLWLLVVAEKLRRLLPRS
jgi:hypothetical protein